MEAELLVTLESNSSHDVENGPNSKLLETRVEQTKQGLMLDEFVALKNG